MKKIDSYALIVMIAIASIFLFIGVYVSLIPFFDAPEICKDTLAQNKSVYEDECITYNCSGIPRLIEIRCIT